MKDRFEYPEVVVRFYDVIYNKIRSSTDHLFYMRKILEVDGPVLEIGTGTGRFFCEALEKGADIYGIDSSELMLNKLKGKIISQEHYKIKHQDARNMSLGKKFKLIIAPFRIFSHLLSIKDQLRVLNKVNEHLDKDGKFIFDVFVPDPITISEGRAPIIDFEGEYEQGKKLKRITSVIPDYINQMSLVTMKFEWQEDGAKKEGIYKFPFRYYFRYEIENLIARSSLWLDKIYGDFNEKNLHAGSKDFVIQCSRD
jgi:SAM-dependent methyltransferase